nr:MAG TPA: hypothetical protein [Caudoviricetes sp.]
MSANIISAISPQANGSAGGSGVLLSLFGSYECIIARIFLAVKNMANIFLSHVAQKQLFSFGQNCILV